MKEPVKGVILRVARGHHGLFCFTSVETEATKLITFSLEPYNGISAAWSDRYPPEEGQYVALEDIRIKVNGWKAMTARPWTEEDEKRTDFEKDTYSKQLELGSFAQA